jgi:hypothetical protein
MALNSVSPAQPACQSKRRISPTQRQAVHITPVQHQPYVPIKLYANVLAYPVAQLQGPLSARKKIQIVG